MHSGRDRQGLSRTEGDQPEPTRPVYRRKVLQEKAIAIENDIRGPLRNFGLKVGIIGKVRFEDRIRELVAGLPDLAEVIACLPKPVRACGSVSPSCIAKYWRSSGTMTSAGA